MMPSGIAYPTRYAVPRILSSGLLRAGGILDAEEDLPAGVRRLNQLNRALVLEMAARWGVAVEWIAGADDEAQILLDSGDLDLIVGLKPDWGKAHVMDSPCPTCCTAIG